MSQTTALTEHIGQPWLHHLDTPLLRSLLYVSAGAGGTLGALAVVYAPVDSLLLRLAWACLVTVLPVITLVDVVALTIPNRIVYPTAALVITLVLASLEWVAISHGLLVGAIVALITLAVWLLSPAGFGFGDVRLMVLAGFVVGTSSISLGIAALLVAPAFLAVLPMLVLITQHRRDDVALPFGPFIAISTIIATFAPQALLIAV